MLITRLLLVLEVWDAKPTRTKSWAGNLLMLDLTFGPPSRSKDGSLALVNCLSSGYKFTSVLRCVGLVIFLLYISVILHAVSKIICSGFHTETVLTATQ